ncbi:hypothetical protein AQUCO_01600355v1 [Aquilegia coerulea]|uniref:F-box domain-containing protein n=1 Tax=Aquilegia coerulea TaxID=218851 RepID=A0A2G5DR77_AQUCA|nr:hypothetical protein AQUCO_01600355v1 [Aquilegia coerulea]
MEEGDNNLPIPNDILVEILTRVPPTSLLRFKCVCKHWYSLIQDPIFVDNQLNQAKKRVCNPIIPKTVTLPQPRCFGDRSVWCRIGFGYDTCSRKYKLAGWISTCWPDIEVFTLGDSWTKIKTTEEIHSPSVYHAQVIYANGALYWNDRRMQEE